MYAASASTGFSRNDLIRALPYARRYARALAGSQPGGDALVAASLRDLMAELAPEGANDPSDHSPPGHHEARHRLYGAVSRRFASDHLGLANVTPHHATSPAGLNVLQRQLLLLTALEELNLATAARLLDVSGVLAEAQLEGARARLRSAAAADVLIIEDEPIIAMDIEGLVQSCGHRVVGIASSEAEAVQIAARTRPGLILADINLGIGGDGAAAVARILQHHQAPVIFVTAYPERLLTGAASEPAFVITKPFEPLTLAIATYQAVTGGVVLS
jgi:CheY-like chemotaxis protein